jgi:hypothetical protein
MGNSAWEAVDFDTTIHDNAGLHDDVTNNSRMTVPSGVSKVRLTGNIGLAANATGIRAWRISKSGSPVAGLPRVDELAASSGSPAVGLVTSVLEVVPGDYFELEVFQNSGSGLNTSNADGAPWFAMEIVE